MLKEVNVTDLKDNFKIIDVREGYEFAGGRIPGSKNISLGDLASMCMTDLDKSETYYIICASGMRSVQACLFLSKLGFDVVNIKGGISEYELKFELEI